MTRAALIVRMCYEPGYEPVELAWRFNWFRTRTLPLILDQRREDFDLWVWVHPAHQAEVAAMSPFIHTFTAGSAVPLDSRIPWDDAYMPRYPIQLRLDSDDLIAPNYVRTAIKSVGNIPGRALVWFQPYKVDIETGIVYWCAPTGGRYRDNKPSAFLALKQPVSGPYDWVYGVGHTRAWRLADTVARIGIEGLCVAACHSYNDSTHVNEGDRVVLRPGWLRNVGL